MWRRGAELPERQKVGQGICNSGLQRDEAWGIVDFVAPPGSLLAKKLTEWGHPRHYEAIMFASGAVLCPLGLGPAKQGFAGGNVRATASAISSNLSGNFLDGRNVTEDV